MGNSFSAMADAVLILHTLVVAFIVVSLLLILAGGWRRWRWIRAFWFRFSHLAAIGIVVAQAWLGRLCPLTILENWLRQQAGVEPDDQAFIQYWFQRILYYDFPLWVFTLAYTAFALLVVFAWFKFPPRARGQ